MSMTRLVHRIMNPVLPVLIWGSKGTSCELGGMGEGRKRKEHGSDGARTAGFRGDARRSPASPSRGAKETVLPEEEYKDRVKYISPA
jgi:hypothetical protein